MKYLMKFLDSMIGQPVSYRIITSESQPTMMDLTSRREAPNSMSHGFLFFRNLSIIMVTATFLLY